MAALASFLQGESLTIGFILPIDYNFNNIDDIKIYLGAKSFQYEIVDSVIKCSIKSDETKMMLGNQNLVFWLDDKVFGVKKKLVGVVEFKVTNATATNDSINTEYDILVNLSVTETAIEVDDVLYDYVKGDDAYHVWLLENEGTLQDYYDWLQKPATDAAGLAIEATGNANTAIEALEALNAEVTEDEELRVTAENNRVSFYQQVVTWYNNAVSAISTALSNIGIAIQNANNATQAANTAAGTGIKSVAKTNTTGLVDTYTITYNNDSTSTFTLTNGKDVEIQVAGGFIQWRQTGGVWANLIQVSTLVGATGRGVSSITRTAGNGAAGTTDTYTITYSDATTSTFNVVNGADGVTPTIQNIGTLINSASNKATLVDADQIGIMDSADTNKLKKWSWANIKTQLNGLFFKLDQTTPQTLGSSGSRAAKIFATDLETTNMPTVGGVSLNTILNAAMFREVRVLRRGMTIPILDNAAKTFTYPNGDSDLIIFVGGVAYSNAIPSAGITFTLDPVGTSAKAILFELSTKTFITVGWSEVASYATTHIIFATYRYRNDSETFNLSTIDMPFISDDNLFGVKNFSVSLKNEVDTIVKSIAHRGFESIAPENTLPSYKLAKDKGYSYVECDVQFTSDGIPVLLHDTTINRTSNGTGAINDMTIATAKTYDFGAWKNAKYTGTRIPTFDEFILYCKRLNLRPYIELKGSVTAIRASSLEQIVKKYNMQNNVVWMSFGTDGLGEILTKFPNAKIIYLVGILTSGEIATAVGLKTATNTVSIGAQITYITQALVQEALSGGVEVAAWTADNNTNIISLVGMGVDEIINNGVNVSEKLYS